MKALFEVGQVSALSPERVQLIPAVRGQAARAGPRATEIAGSERMAFTEALTLRALLEKGVHLRVESSQSVPLITSYQTVDVTYGRGDIARYTARGILAPSS